MVISGGSYRPDTLKPTEVVSLLIDDAEMQKKCEFGTQAFSVKVAECVVMKFWTQFSGNFLYSGMCESVQEKKKGGWLEGGEKEGERPIHYFFENKI